MENHRLDSLGHQQAPVHGCLANLAFVSSSQLETSIWDSEESLKSLCLLTANLNSFKNNVVSHWHTITLPYSLTVPIYMKKSTNFSRILAQKFILVWLVHTVHTQKFWHLGPSLAWQFKSKAFIPAIPFGVISSWELRPAHSPAHVIRLDTQMDSAQTTMITELWRTASAATSLESQTTASAATRPDGQGRWKTPIFMLSAPLQPCAKRESQVCPQTNDIKCHVFLVCQLPAFLGQQTPTGAYLKPSLFLL